MENHSKTYMAALTWKQLKSTNELELIIVKTQDKLSMVPGALNPGKARSSKQEHQDPMASKGQS